MGHIFKLLIEQLLTIFLVCNGVDGDVTVAIYPLLPRAVFGCLLTDSSSFYCAQFQSLENKKLSTYQLAQMADKANGGNGNLGTDIVFVKPAGDALTNVSLYPALPASFFTRLLVYLSPTSL